MRVVDLEEVSIGRYEEAEIPAFAENDRISSCPSLITDEKSKTTVRETTHNK
jgi:hypothetical protein